MTSKRIDPEYVRHHQPRATRVSRVTNSGGGWSRPEDVVRFAAATVGSLWDATHCGLSSITADGLPETISSTDDIPIRADYLAHELREGPGLPAPGEADGTPLVSSDLLGEERWPEFSSMCASVLGVRSLLRVAVPPSSATSPVAITFYSGHPDAFSTEDVDVAEGIADTVAHTVGLDAAVSPLRRSRMSNSRLASALGILMARYRLLPPEAFELLDKASRTSLAAILRSPRRSMPQDASLRPFDCDSVAQRSTSRAR